MAALHAAATAAAESLNTLIEALDRVSSFGPGWGAREPVASALLAFQVDLFSLGTLVDRRFADAGGTRDGAGRWTLPDGSPLTPLVAPRNDIVHFQTGVLPTVLSAGSAAAARDVFETGGGCDLVGAWSAAVDTVIGGGS